MAQVRLKVPYFARCSTYEVLEKSLQEGGFFYNLDRIAYVLVSDTQILYHVSPDKTITPIMGANEGSIKRLDTLPDPSEAKTDALYIVGNTVYSFDGTDFHATYEEIQDTIDTLSQQVADVAATVATYDDKIAAIEQEAAEITDAFITINNTLDAHTTSIDALQADVDDLKPRMGAVENTVDGHTRDIASLNSTQTEQGAKIANMQAVQTFLDRHMSQIDTRLDNTYTKTEVDSVVGDLGGASSVVDYVDTQFKLNIV